MNYSGWRFLLFALFGLLGIALLATIGLPRRPEERGVNRYTGRRGVEVHTIADALAEARASGNARTALESIRKREKRFPNESILLRYEAVFSAELSKPDEVPESNHPTADTIRAEQARRDALIKEFRRNCAEKRNRQELLGLLSDLQADRAVSAATEDFFSPLARWKPENEPANSRPDELAARTLASFLTEQPHTGSSSKLLAVADAFRSQDRMRARMRWLLRAYSVAGDRKAVYARLLQAYMESGRLPEALAVTGTALLAHPDSRALWAQRAKIAGWLSLPRAEAEAREHLVGGADDHADRKRLVALYLECGEPEKAVPHAERLARDSTDAKTLEYPAILELEAGNVTEALAILERVAAKAEDPTPWQEKVVKYALEDLRIPRALAELKKLDAEHPDGKYEKELEGLYRRRNMSGPLADLLVARWRRHPEDTAALAEAAGLLNVLGRLDEAKAIESESLERQTDPKAFFDSIETYRALGIPGVAKKADALARSPALAEKDLDAIFKDLRPYLHEAGSRKLVDAIARRFPQDPASRSVRLEILQYIPDDDERAKEAEALAQEDPKNPALLRAWIDNASWSGDLDGQIRAREAYAKLHPDDAGNLSVLAQLYEDARRPGEAAREWRKIVQKEGERSDAVLHLIDDLFAAGKTKEAMSWLEKRASRPDASKKERLHVAETLFAKELYDRALRFYLAVLDLDENDPTALLRVGQIRSWTSDPRGSIPFFEKRLKSTDEDAGEVRFYLGEALWAIHEDSAAKREQEQAREALEKIANRTADQDAMLAKIYARFGEMDRARPIYDRLLQARPKDVGLLLDYADATMSVGDSRTARTLVDRARSLAPGARRVLRLDGQLCIAEHRYAEAAAALRRRLKDYGPDAGAAADLGLALQRGGEPRQALAAYRTSLTLQPENGEVAHEVASLKDAEATQAEARVRYRKVADDSALEATVEATILLHDDRTRLGGSVGLGTYRGRAAAYMSGTQTLSKTVGLFSLTASRRFGAATTAGAGIDLYPGAAGGLPVGGWLGIGTEGSDPYWSAALRLHFHELWSDPTAAVGLGGRSTGARLEGMREFGRFWASGSLQLEELELDALPNGKSAADGRLVGEAILGYRIRSGPLRLADPLDVRVAPYGGLVTPQLQGSVRDGNNPSLYVWGSLQSIRLFGNRNLADMVPVGRDFDYVTAGARADWRFAEDLGGRIQGYGGTEVRTGDVLYGLDVGLTYRRTQRLAFTLDAGLGQAIGRQETNSLAYHLWFGVHFRW